MFPKFIFSKFGSKWSLFFDKGSNKALRNPARRHFVKNADPSDPNFGKIISGNIPDHEEDTLGIILSPISGL